MSIEMKYAVKPADCKWDYVRFKDVFVENKRRQHDKTVLSLSFGKVIIKNFDGKKGVLPESFESYQGVLLGDIILRLTDLQNDQKSLRVGLAKMAGIITSAYLSISSKKLISSFSTYYLHDLGDIQKTFYSLGGGVRQSMKFSDMGDIVVSVPSLPEQQAIADFLDRETALIDRRLALIERKKELLSELKKSVVHEAVTKGLDRGVAMKDSGVDWIGEIPGAWRVGRVKEGLHPKKKINKDRQEGNILSLTMKGVLRNNSEKPIGLVPSDYASYQVFEKNELVFKLIDLENTKTSRVGLVWERGIMSPAYIRMAISTSMIADYAYWLFIDWWNRDVFQLHGGNGVRSSLSASDLLKLQIAMPPIAEQKAIVEHLGRETSRFDKMAKLLARQEELLKEQRKALIHEVVTGKRRVI